MNDTVSTSRLLDFGYNSWILAKMNGKTAKLLNKYSLAKGENINNLKRLWYSLNARDRFLKRQELIKELKR